MKKKDVHLSALKTIWFFLVALLFSTPLWGQALTPYYTRNQAPFVHIFGIPGAESGQLIDLNKIEIRLIYEVIHNFTGARTPNESIFTDGETHKTNFILRWRAFETVELGLDLPYVAHNSGTLDNFIEEWHSTFGFSNDDRRKFSKNKLIYQYKEHGRQTITFDQPSAGLGDIMFSAAFPWNASGKLEKRFISTRVGIKLNTGDPKKLHGSGGIDSFASMNVDDHELLESWKIPIFGGIGLLFIGESEIIPARTNPIVGFGNIGLGKMIYPRLTLKTQLDFHTPFYDSELPQLGSFSVQLTLGGTIHLPKKFTLDLGVSEDINKDISPDIVFHIGIRRQF